MKKWLCGVMLIISIFVLPGCNLLNPNTNNIKNEDTLEEISDTPSEEETDKNNVNEGKENNDDITSKDDSKANNGKSDDISKENNEKDDEEKTETPKPKSSQYEINDFFPFKANTWYIYEGKGNEFAGYTVWVDYIRGNKIQQRLSNDGTELAKVIENKNGELKIVFTREESYYREDFTSKTSNKDEILLKEPLVKGTSWTLANGQRRYISALDVSVSTPYGNFKALEVTTEGSDFKNLDYYALNIGLVKSIFQAGGDEVSSSLSEIQTNSNLTKKVAFYYPNSKVDKLFLVRKDLTFKTNTITKLVFEKNFQSVPNEELIKLISPNTKINSLFLHSDGMVYVDFSKELITEMNLGANYEGMVLQAITNTLGLYYNAKKVYITVENKPYESGHILMKKGEPFIVNVNDVVEPE